MTLVIAHRGASAYEHENTLRAFQRAAEMGADGVELDVHGSSDGKLVVYHDEEIDGVPIGERSLDDIRKIELPGDQRPPTLEEALEVISGVAYIEVKSLNESAAAELFQTIDKYGADKCHVHSFYHRLIRLMYEERTDITYGVLNVALAVRPELHWRDAGATEVWQNAQFIDESVVAAAHADGARVVAWTVDDERRMKQLEEMLVDAVCTNKPDIAVKCLK